MPTRDDEGQFTSSRSRYDDDDDRRRSMPARNDEGRFTSSRSRYDDDDDRRRSMPARDDEGRFTSSRSRYGDDDDRRSSPSRSRYDEDDDDRRGGRGHGRWYGDPEGHSEASHRGWRSAAVRAAAIATMTAGARCRRGTMKAGSPARGHVTMKMTGAVAAGMAAGTAIPRATPKRHGTAGKSAAVLTPVIESDDDDRRRSMPARDDEGRFTSSRSRYDDDDDDRRGSRAWRLVRRSGRPFRGGTPRPQVTPPVHLVQSLQRSPLEAFFVMSRLCSTVVLARTEQISLPCVLLTRLLFSKATAP